MRKVLLTPVFAAILMVVSATSAYADAPIVELNTGHLTQQHQPVMAENTHAVGHHQPELVSQTRQQVNLSLPQKVQRLENQVDYLNQVTPQIKSLQQSIDDLRGQIETMRYSIKKLQADAKGLNDLEQRLSRLETQVQLKQAVKSPGATGSGDLGSASEPSTPKAAYQAAYQLVEAEKYPEAIKSFNAFLKAYPESHYVASTHYWLGELYLVQKQSDKATQQFRVVVNKFKNHSKVADAMLKLGLIFLANGDTAHAKQMFQQVAKKYPKSAPAILAKKQLGKLKKE